MARSGVRQFLRTSAVYFVGAALAKLVSFFLLPLYTRFLTPAEFGGFDFWTNLVSFAAPIAFFQVWDATYRFLLHDSVDHRQVVTNSYALMGWGLLLYSVTVLPILQAFSAPVWLAFLVGLTLCLQYFYGFFARAQMRNGLFVSTGILNTAVSATTSLVALVVFHQGVAALYWALIVGNLVQASVLALRLRPGRDLDTSALSRSVQWRLLRFSLPLCVASAAYWLLAGFARLEIMYFDGPDENGLYGVAMRFATVVTTLTSVFLYAWNEFLYTARREEGAAGPSSRAPALVLELSLAGAAATIALVHLSFDLLIDDRYAAARAAVPIVVLATCLNGAASFVASLFMAEMRTGWILWTTVGAALLNVVLGVLATRAFGLLGATSALAASFGVLLVARALLAQRLLKVRALDRNLLLSIALLGTSGLLYYLEAPRWSAVLVIAVVAGNAVASLMAQSRERDAVSA